MDFFYSADAVQKVPTRQAFSKARDKISYRAFKDFFDKSCELVVDYETPKLYKNYRLMAIDGTSFVVGKLEDLSEYFGTSTTVPGKSMCRISAVVDVLDDSIGNAIVAPFSKGERELAIHQVKSLKNVSNALFLFDRGYWSAKLVADICDNNQKFIMRLQSSNTKSSVTGSDGCEINLRRHKFTLPSGIEEVLITNLSTEEMTDNELADLYPKRWGVETKYLELKDRLQIDKFSGTSSNSVLQDIFSTLYMSNLIAFICHSANQIVEEKESAKDNKYKQKVNKSTCIATFRRRFVDICVLDDTIKQQARLDKLYRDLSSCVVYKEKSKSRHRDKRKLKHARAHYRKPIL
jgi:hypothetical protein